MKYIARFSQILLLVLALTSCGNENGPHYLTGRVMDSEIQSILLKGINQDLRVDSIIEIPVENGKFKHEFHYNEPLAFDLMLGRAKEFEGGRYMPIFLHNTDVELTIHGEENFEKNEVRGGKLNEEYQGFKKYIDSVSKQNAGFNFSDQLALEDLYMEKNPSIVSYYIFLRNLIYFQDLVDLEEAKRIHGTLSQSNEHHPYNELSANLIDAMDNIMVGKKYVDFSAPDLDGQESVLSNQIEGKVSLLNLWATWCGPCIRKSREVVPIYEQFKDKGFVIVNVAGEFGDTNRLEQFFKKEKWPGKNLVELDRKNNIWQKYGVDGGGGGMFLIDQGGKLIAINPSPEEIQHELEKRLIF